ncbi:hypothetical protein MFUL124B02_29520 [Myxococcus fulvus 124B02]|nr:hypothetical protein MFUL124B02_29520 [Myxococcus fulvus 124B02]
MDPVLGLDIHVVGVPAPPAPLPVPVPVPMPFVGLVFDPMGMLVGAAITRALGGQPNAVLINGLPATNCGTNVTNMLTLPHLPAPGVAFIPPPKPGNDAELYFGAKDVSIAGSLGVRLGDIALSCSDPVRMPTSLVLALPKGAPVLVMKPMVPDLASIAMALGMRAAMRALGAVLRAGGRLLRALRRTQQASGRWRAASRALHDAVDRMVPRRVRSRVHRAVCFLTGHPVDVATGRLLTHREDFHLPGPLPLRFERAYDSALSFRDGPLGRGWSHTLNQAVWLERGRVVYLAEDGREIEFDTTRLPGRTVERGQSLYHPLERLTLRCLDHRCWELETHDGVTHRFGPVTGGDPARAVLRSKETRTGNTVRLDYDENGRLEACRDSVGRRVLFEHDRNGRLVAIRLPLSRGEGWYVHARYRYDARGDLVEVLDAEGNAQKFEYVGHLMVKETDRTGLSFYFQWDGQGSGARCIRTWGDGGIFDHVITYDLPNRRTLVENSLGHVTQYALDELSMVVAVTDPQGGVTRYEWDPDTGQQARVTDPLGRAVSRRYDERGNCVQVTGPGASVVSLSYDSRNQLTRVEQSGGATLDFAYDPRGRLTHRVDAQGGVTRMEYEQGQLRRIVRPDGGLALLDYDKHENLRQVRTPRGEESRTWFDTLGRPIKSRDRHGAVTARVYDSLGRVAQLQSDTGFRREYRYDAEGHVLEVKDPGQHVRMTYAGNHWLASTEERGLRVHLTHDLEGQLVRVTNTAGELYRYELDACSRVKQSTSFDGRTHTYEYDACGRVVALQRASGKRTLYDYDDRDQMTRVRYPDGRSESYRYDDASGAMLEAINDDVALRFERDAQGRVLRERSDDDWVESTYAPSGVRVQFLSSQGLNAHLHFDAAHRIEALAASTERAKWAATFTRDELGRERERAFPGEVKSLWDWDAQGFPARRASVHGDRLMAERRYEWSPGGQLLAIDGGAQGRLRAERTAGGGLLGAHLPDGSYQSRFPDEAGNLFQHPDPSHRSHGPGGRLLCADGVTYRHDDDGQLIEARRGDTVTRYQWNGAGMLETVLLPGGERVSFTYDAMGRRTRKRIHRNEETVSETRWVWDGAVPLHEQRLGQEPITWLFEPHGMTPLARLQGERQWSILTDHLGTPTEMVDEEGQLAWRMQMGLHGATSVEEHQTDCPFRWPGQYEDPETGLYYNRFRYYSPETGGYLSADPLGLVGGLNAYRYVADPLTQWDPLGLTSCSRQDLLDLPPNSAVVRVSDGHVAIYLVDSQGNRTWSSLGVTSQGSARRFTSQAQFDNFVRNATPQDLQNAGLPVRIFSNSDGMGNSAVQDFLITSDTAGRSINVDAMMARHQASLGGGGGRYNVDSNNCVTHVRDILQSGGVEAPPGPSRGNLPFFSNNVPGNAFDGNIWSTLYGG